MSPPIAPPPRPFALADIVCDCCTSGELCSHSCAACQQVRGTFGTAGAIRRRPEAEHRERVDFDERSPSPPRQWPLGRRRCVRARSGARQPLAALYSACSWTRVIVLFAGPSARVLPSSSRSAEVGLAAAERVRVVGPAVGVDAAPLGRCPTAVRRPQDALREYDGRRAHDGTPRWAGSSGGRMKAGVAPSNRVGHYVWTPPACAMRGERVGARPDGRKPLRVLFYSIERCAAGSGRMQQRTNAGLAELLGDIGGQRRESTRKFPI